MSLPTAASPLPIAANRAAILELVAAHSVTFVSGGTGCGKSTQLPQYLAESAQSPSRVVFVTQPRRLAVTSIAARVSAERDERVGESVGYSMGGENLHRGSTEKIRYVTAGWLATWILGSGGSNLAGCSHLVLDEVHERSVDDDLLCQVVVNVLRSVAAKLLASLRCATQLVIQGDARAAASCVQGAWETFRYRPRVVLMSATGNMSPLIAYFSKVADESGSDLRIAIADGSVDALACSLGQPFSAGLLANHIARTLGCGGIHVGGAPHQVRHIYLEDIYDEFGGEIARDEFSALRTGFDSAVLAGGCEPNDIKMRALYNLTARVALASAARYSPESVLVFVSGMRALDCIVSALLDLSPRAQVEEVGESRAPPDRIRILALHSLLSAADQTRALRPDGGPTIIVATAIAESSITLGNVTTVVDTCIRRALAYRPAAHTRVLDYSWASKASMQQRAGRVGRTQPGRCFRLCTREFHDTLVPAHDVPEMERADLDSVLLRMASAANNHPTALPARDRLMSTVSPPIPEAVDDALARLGKAGLIHGGALLTPLGAVLARYPGSPLLGRLVVFGHALGVLPDAVMLAAAIQVGDLFCVSSIANESSVEAHCQRVARATRSRWEFNCCDGESSMAGTRLCIFSQPIATRAAYTQWRAEPRQNRTAWCDVRGVDGNSMNDLHTAVRSIARFAEEQGLGPPLCSGVGSSDSLSELRGDLPLASRRVNVQLLRVVLAAGLCDSVVQAEGTINSEVHSALLDAGISTTRGIALNAAVGTTAEIVMSALSATLGECAVALVEPWLPNSQPSSQRFLRPRGRFLRRATAAGIVDGGGYRCLPTTSGRRHRKLRGCMLVEISEAACGVGLGGGDASYGGVGGSGDRGSGGGGGHSGSDSLDAPPVGTRSGDDTAPFAVAAPMPMITLRALHTRVGELRLPRGNELVGWLGATHAADALVMKPFDLDNTHAGAAVGACSLAWSLCPALSDPGHFHAVRTTEAELASYNAVAFDPIFSSIVLPPASSTEPGVRFAVYGSATLSEQRAHQPPTSVIDGMTLLWESPRAVALALLVFSRGVRAILTWSMTPPASTCTPPSPAAPMTVSSVGFLSSSGVLAHQVNLPLDGIGLNEADLAAVCELRAAMSRVVSSPMTHSLAAGEDLASRVLRLLGLAGPFVTAGNTLSQHVARGSADDFTLRSEACAPHAVRPEPSFRHETVVSDHVVDLSGGSISARSSPQHLAPWIVVSGWGRRQNRSHHAAQRYFGTTVGITDFGAADARAAGRTQARSPVNPAANYCDFGGVEGVVPDSWEYASVSLQTSQRSGGTLPTSSALLYRHGTPVEGDSGSLLATEDGGVTAKTLRNDK